MMDNKVIIIVYNSGINNDNIAYNDIIAYNIVGELLWHIIIVINYCECGINNDGICVTIKHLSIWDYNGIIMEYNGKTPGIMG
jgi:hypothetical protein